MVGIFTITGSVFDQRQTTIIDIVYEIVSQFMFHEVYQYSAFRSTKRFEQQGS